MDHKNQSLDLFEELAEIFFRHDPVGIDLEIYVDEYKPEVAAVLPRLLTARGVDDVTLILFEEFKRRFGDSAGRLEYYQELAVDVWKAWLPFRPGSGTE